MIYFNPSSSVDIPTIQIWTDADDYHKGQKNPEWWLTGNGLLSFALYDDNGPILFVRLDSEKEYVVLNVQFAPVSVVSKIRLVRALLEAFPKIVLLAKARGYEGILFKSDSISLIRFMGRLGFKEIDGNFVMPFGE
jgi:hypothetical protein